jgi:hypothetical protein
MSFSTALRPVGQLSADPGLLAIHICIRLRRQKELVVVHDFAGCVRTGAPDDPRSARYTRINHYRHPATRQWIEDDLRHALTLWNKPTC